MESNEPIWSDNTNTLSFVNCQFIDSAHRYVREMGLMSRWDLKRLVAYYGCMSGPDYLDA